MWQRILLLTAISFTTGLISLLAMLGRFDGYNRRFGPEYVRMVAVMAKCVFVFAVSLAVVAVVLTVLAKAWGALVFLILLNLLLAVCAVRIYKKWK